MQSALTLYALGIDSGYAACIIDAMPENTDIKTVRTRLGETQAEFALRFGVDQATIHRWETDGVPARGTARLAVEKVLESLPVVQGAA